MQKIVQPNLTRLNPHVGVTLLTLLISCILLYGCATSSKLAGPVKNFSVSCAEMTVITRTGLEKVVTLDMEKSAAKAAEKEALAEEDFKPFLSPEQFDTRCKALDALEAYAYTLNDLASLDVTEKINETARTFKEKLDGISSLLSPADSQDDRFRSQASSIVATLANAVLRAVVNKKKDDAIRSILPEVNPHINSLCSLIASEFKKRDEREGIGGEFYDQVQHSYRSFQQSLNSRFSKTTNSEEKLRLAREYGELLHNKQVTLALFESIGRSFDKIAKTHSELEKQATQGVSAQVALASLAAEIRSSVLFYKSLQKIR